MTKSFSRKIPKYFVAIGAAMKASKSEEISFAEIIQRAEHADPAKLSDTKHIAPSLLQTKKEYEAFCARHDRDKITQKGHQYSQRFRYSWGIDAGSTTTKAALIDEDKICCTPITWAMKGSLWRRP